MLISKNVWINGCAQDISLEREMWISLADICTREKMHIRDLCSRIDTVKNETDLSSALRLFILLYFRSALKKREDVLTRAKMECA